MDSDMDSDAGGEWGMEGRTIWDRIARALTLHNCHDHRQRVWFNAP